MAISKDFSDYVLDQLSNWEEVYSKRMFGGAALYQDDLAFAMIADNVVYFKVDDSNKDKYIRSGSYPLKPFKNSATVLSFYSIPTKVLEDHELLIEWAKESLNIQKKKKRIV